MQCFNVLVGESLAIGHARSIHKGQFVVKDLNLIVVRDFTGAGNPDFYQRLGRMAAKKDVVHSQRSFGCICDVWMVFGVFHDNQAPGAVLQQQLGVKEQPMWLSHRERDQHRYDLDCGHDVAHWPRIWLLSLTRSAQAGGRA